MANSEQINQYRFFLKDTIRQQINFAGTAQHRGQPAPPLQSPCADDLPRVELPDGAKAVAGLSFPLGQAILQRESLRTYASAPFSLIELSALLYATQGVRETLTPHTALRTVPSAGARHAFETYLAVEQVDGLEQGLYRYLPFDQQLAQIYSDTRMGLRAAQACLDQPFVADAAVTFFWTAIPARSEWRYDLAAHKVIALDAGHLCQNLYLACEAMNAGTVAIAAYDQDLCDELLEVDGEEEFTVYIAAAGKKPA